MSRWEAIEALKYADDDESRHMAQLLAEGPMISEDEEAKLLDWMPLPPPLTIAVRMALRG